MPTPPKPKYLRELQGNPGRRPVNKNEPDPEPLPGVPEPPELLKGEALAEWQRLAPELVRLGALTALDLGAFEAYCWAFGRFRDAQARIEQYGDLVTTPNGMLQQSPYVGMANRALENMNRFLQQFGLSPSSRTRLSVEPAATDKPLDLSTREGVKAFLFGTPDGK